MKLQEKLQKEKRNTAIQTETVAWLRNTIQSFNTNVETLCSEVEIPPKSRKDAEFMCDGSKAQEAFLAAKSSKLAQQLDEVKKMLLLFVDIYQIIVPSSQLISCDASQSFIVFLWTSLARKCNVVNKRSTDQSLMH